MNTLSDTDQSKIDVVISLPASFRKYISAKCGLLTCEVGVSFVDENGRLATGRFTCHEFKGAEKTNGGIT